MEFDISIEMWRALRVGSSTRWGRVVSKVEIGANSGYAMTNTGAILRC